MTVGKELMNRLGCQGEEGQTPSLPSRDREHLSDAQVLDTGVQVQGCSLAGAEGRRGLDLKGCRSGLRALETPRILLRKRVR